MTGVNKQSNAKETKADEVCTNKCPNKKTHSQQNVIFHYGVLQALDRWVILVEMHPQ